MSLRRGDAPAATWSLSLFSHWRSRLFVRPLQRGLARVEPSENRVRQAHSSECARGREQSGPEGVADNRADAWDGRQEEADGDAGEGAQNEEDPPRDHIDNPTFHGCGAQARIPEKREGDDERDDANARPPSFAICLTGAPRKGGTAPKPA
jgi:hypothetical protein